MEKIQFDLFVEWIYDIQRVVIVAIAINERIVEFISYRLTDGER